MLWFCSQSKKPWAVLSVLVSLGPTASIWRNTWESGRAPWFSVRFAFRTCTMASGMPSSDQTTQCLMVSGEKQCKRKYRWQCLATLDRKAFAEYVIWIISGTLTLIRQIWLSLEAVLAPVATHRMMNIFPEQSLLLQGSQRGAGATVWVCQHSAVDTEGSCSWLAAAELICGAASWGLLSLSTFFTHQIVIFWESVSCLATGSGCALSFQLGRKQNTRDSF